MIKINRNIICTLIILCVLLSGIKLDSASKIDGIFKTNENVAIKKGTVDKQEVPISTTAEKINIQFCEIGISALFFICYTERTRRSAYFKDTSIHKAVKFAKQRPRSEISDPYENICLKKY